MVQIHTDVRPRSRVEPPKLNPQTADSGGKVAQTSFGCGCSSVVEHHVANVMVVSSNLITRSIFRLIDQGWAVRHAG